MQNVKLDPLTNPDPRAIISIAFLKDEGGILPSDLTFPIIVALAISFLLWFALGSQWNVRKGHQVLRWLQDGLPLLGERTTLRWLGTSVVELGITKPNDPFRNAQVLLIFEPRDIPLMWGWARLHKRRDLMILRTRLRQPPRFELELADKESWTGRDALNKLDASAWNQANLGEPGLILAYQGNEAVDLAATSLAHFRQLGSQVCRLSVRRTEPHLEIHLLLPRTGAVSARQLFSLCKETGRKVMSPQETRHSLPE